MWRFDGKGPEERKIGGVVKERQSWGGCGGRRIWSKARPHRVLATDPAQGPGLSFLPGTCVTITSEEPAISDDYRQVNSKAFLTVRSREPRKVPSENAL